MTRASEEGLSLIKEEVVEYFPLFCCFCLFVCLELATVSKNGEAFCIRVFSVNKISGHIWGKIVQEQQTRPFVCRFAFREALFSFVRSFV